MNLARLTSCIVLFVLSISLVACNSGECHPTLPAQVVAKYVTYWDADQDRYLNHFVVVRDVNGTFTYRIRQQEYETIQIGEVWKTSEKVEVSRSDNGTEQD